MVKNKNHKLKLKPKEKLIKVLIENKEPQSILSLSGSAVMDYKNTYNYVGELTASGAIVQNVIGKIKSIQLSLSPNQDIFSVEQKRTADFLENNPKLKILKNYIEEMNYPFLIVLVFGSYVKNTKTESSDIDICIISDNKDKTKELHERLGLLSLKLEVQDFTSKEFIAMIEKSQNNLGHEIIKSNIILYGAENYYNLISKWMKKE